MGKTEIIQRLNALDLNSCKDKEILDLINNNSYPLQFMDVMSDQLIVRATVLSKEEKIENITRDRLSYLPANKNTKYQRASIPNNTMFYGIMPNHENILCRDSGFAAACFETSPFFRDKARKTEWQVHVVSKWVVKDPIRLLVIADPYLNNKSCRLNDCSKHFRTFVQGEFPSELAKKEFVFQRYIYEQFSTPFDDECKYRIPALYAHMLLSDAKKQKKKVDGLVWQSAINIDPNLDDALCVAILPEIIDGSFQPPDCFFYMEKYHKEAINKFKIKYL